MPKLVWLISRYAWTALNMIALFCVPANWIVERDVLKIDPKWTESKVMISNGGAGQNFALIDK